MHLISRFAAASLLLAGTASTLPSLRADTLVWGNTTYAPTSAQTIQQTNVATINGNTVSIQFGNNTFFTATPASPAVGTYGNAGATGTSTSYTDGGATGKAALQILADFDNSAGKIIAGSSIPVTVFFSRPVSNLMFSFYDVDTNAAGANAPFTDYITNVFGLGTGGAAVPPISITSGTANTNTIGATSASVTATANSAQTVADGNAVVRFGSTPITQFTFTYTDTASASGGTTHGMAQVIALSDLTFTTVPEPSTFALAGAAGALVFGLAARRRVSPR